MTARLKALMAYETITRGVGAKNSTYYRRLQSAIGKERYGEKDYAAAAEHFRVALQQCLRQEGEGARASFTLRSHLALALINLGEVDEAFILHTENVRRMVDTPGLGQGEMVAERANLGFVTFCMAVREKSTEMADDAERIVNEALTWQEEHIGGASEQARRTRGYLDTIRKGIP